MVSLRDDKRRREEEAGAEVEVILGSDPPLHQEAWHQIKGWYQDGVKRALPPASVTLQRMTAGRVELYNYVLPPGANIPFFVEHSRSMTRYLQRTISSGW